METLTTKHTITGMHFDSNLYQNATHHPQRTEIPFTQDQSLSHTTNQEPKVPLQLMVGLYIDQPTYNTH